MIAGDEFAEVVLPELLIRHIRHMAAFFFENLGTDARTLRRERDQAKRTPS
jgi:hypothetical protein